jgi:hypothetical protein
MTNVVQDLRLIRSHAEVDWVMSPVLVPSFPLLADSLVDRLITGLERDLSDEENGCHLWSRAVTGRGYGAIWHLGTVDPVHRLAWELEKGPAPVWVLQEDGWHRVVLDHECHNLDLSCKGGTTCLHRRCGRVDHLRLATQRTNVSRGRRWARAA